MEKEELDINNLENELIKSTDISKQSDEKANEKEKEKTKIILITKFSNLDPELFLMKIY